MWLCHRLPTEHEPVPIKDEKGDASKADVIAGKDKKVKQEDAGVSLDLGIHI